MGGNVVALRGIAIATGLLTACDPTSRLAPAAAGAASDAEQTLPNENPLPWSEDTDDGVDTADTGDTDDDPGPTLTPVSLAAGARTTCVRRSDATLDCWGYNRGGAATEPSGRFQKISSAALWACGLTSNGSITCWGDVSAGLLSPPSGRYAGVVVGPDAACAWANDGALSCWGNLGSPPNDLPDAVDVAVGDGFACVAAADGEVACFGRGELSAPDDVTAEALHAGDDHVCAIDEDGSVQCWGADGAGQASAPGAAFDAMDAAGATSCALASGTLTCWGDAADALAPDGLPNLASFVIGPAHGCGITSRDEVVCWGDDTYAQASPPVDDAAQVAMGPERFGCSRTARGVVDCFGDGIPVGDEPDVAAEDLALGFRHACVLDDNGDDTCWGSTFGGRIAVPESPTWRDIALSNVGGCGIRVDGALECWGDTFTGVDPVDGPYVLASGGDEHAVALGPTGDFACVGETGGGRCNAPGSSTFEVASAGADTTCGIDDGTLLCFGKTGAITSPPTGTFIDVSVADDHACAVDDGGAVRCWGDDDEGETTPPNGTFQQPTGKRNEADNRLER